MLAKTRGFVITGLDGREVDVEVDTNLGLPGFEIVGLPDAAVKESKERVRSAIKNSGRKFPIHKITVNLAPAELKKEGAGLDLPIAVGIIAANGQLMTNRQSSANRRFASYSQSDASGRIMQDGQFDINGQITQNGLFDENVQITQNGLPDENGQITQNGRFDINEQITPNGQFMPNGQPVANGQFMPDGQPVANGQFTSGGQPANADIKAAMIGELSLDGKIRGVNGILPILISAREKGVKEMIIPAENSEEGSFIDGITVRAAEDLKSVCDYLEGKGDLKIVEKREYAQVYRTAEYDNDLKYVKGQFVARRALEVAVSGNHNIILEGPPGAGKTMLAKCIPSIMPDMSFREALETTKIHSVAGKMKDTEGIVYRRPFMSPHHTASRVSIIGGGQSAKPGVVSLAHNGVLFLDEMPEYPRSVLESLRQPLEDRVITVTRVKANLEYPASFMLAGSMNPCPCGYYGSKDRECTCSAIQIKKYRERISGPLLDRMDIRINVDNVKYDELTDKTEAESSAEVRKRVNRTRALQLERFRDDGISSNAEMSEKHLNKYCVLSRECEEILKYAFESLKMSARARSRIIKVARTIADMDLSENIEPKHLLEAISYRGDGL